MAIVTKEDYFSSPEYLKCWVVLTEIIRSWFYFRFTNASGLLDFLFGALSYSTMVTTD